MSDDALDTELAWLGRLWQWRLAQHFEDAAGEPPPPDPLPALLGTLPEPLRATDARALLWLAMAPWLQPALLDMLFARRSDSGRGFTEFGGLAHGEHGAFAPTGETACFLLAGVDGAQRRRVWQRLQALAALDQGQWLQLGAAPDGQAPLCGAWRPGPRLLRQLLGPLAEPAPATLSGSLAHPLRSGLAWGDLVLPPMTLAQLEEIVLWRTHRQQLLVDWGLGRRLKPGYAALFHGPPGTGKTLSAALLGQRCGRPVMRVDLAALVSKYIGETEKNLALLFDEAERQDWILFFDEADALFGKRSQVSDAHDRYANQEISYLLQRVEEFPGVVLLASNLKGNIDDAFQRRFQSVVAFALPRPAERLRLWQEALPAALAAAPDVDLPALAQRHEIAGGTIMNAVRVACLRAAQRADGLLRASDLDEGVRRELVKEGRSL
jgi:ATPase family associated with various cellular activities (AAA)